MQQLFNFVKSVFTASAVEAPKPTFKGFSWVSPELVAGNSVVYTLSSPNGDGNTANTATGRSRVPVAGGGLIGPGANPVTGKAVSPSLNGYIVAVNGDVDATLHGMPVNGARVGDLWHRFAIDSFLSLPVYNGLAKALREATKAYGAFQLQLEVVHTAYGAGSKYAKEAARFDGEWRELAYHGIRELRAPVKVVAIKVVTPEDVEWVNVPVNAIDIDGMVGVKSAPTASEAKARARAQKAKCDRLSKAFASFGELLDDGDELTLEQKADAQKPKAKPVIDLDAIEDDEPEFSA